MSVRDDKAAELLTQLAAKYIAREAGRDTLITPLRTHLDSSHKNAIIYVSVFPADQGEHAIKFLVRHKDLFREYLKTASRLSRLPYIRFDIDYGEINRQRIEELSKDVGPIPAADASESDSVAYEPEAR